jgi:hypothetical protein
MASYRLAVQWSLKKFGSTGPHLLRPEKRWNLEEHIPDGFPVDELWALYYSSWIWRAIAQWGDNGLENNHEIIQSKENKLSM